MSYFSEELVLSQLNNATCPDKSQDISYLPISPTVPRIVHFLWCSDKGFKFNNYLSVLSSMKYLKPERITFHYITLPRREKFNYYDSWFEELLQNVALFQPTKISSDRVCNTSNIKRQYVVGILQTEGGIYVEESTIFKEDMEHLFKTTKTVKLGNDGTGYVSTVGKDLKVSDLVSNRTTQPCPSFEEVTKIGSCFSIRKRVYPKTFWGLQDVVGRTVNTILYGTEIRPMPRSYDNKVIPNIAHVLWLRGKPVDFLFYLSCMSLIYVAEVEMLFVHGDVEPSGKYWIELKSITNLRFVRIVFPNRVFNFTIRRLSHMSDVFRAMVLWKYGGIYSDVDVIWTQPISGDLFKHDAVASFDWAHAYYPYPDYLNLGVSMGKRGAPFWKKLISSFNDFRDSVFGYNGLLKPYKVYERNPSLVFIHDRIQTMCFKNRCYPKGRPSNKDFRWNTDTFSYHWTWPTPVEFHNQSILFKINSTWADIGRNVLAKAGFK
ncbi:hypothetical protein LSH36_7g20029 [Paralvinella palmiformis]|uniref:Glycosyltransferase n=1 Tax=Paralvinella palmiformis TaxID=53620 RepID=A0AAD9KEI4_9ANNE|nr:hypothetical protein LSH36_7g20029 [Paralvinella palmiformis]